MIDRCRHHLAVAMAVRGDRAGDVDQVHDAAAENVPQQIGVLGEDKFGHFRARRADGTAVRACFAERVCSRRRMVSWTGQAPVWNLAFGRHGEYTMRLTMTQPQKKTRRQMLEEFVAAKPNDAFARYGLAMDCANAGDSAAADEHFQALLATNPDYVPDIFSTGNFWRGRDARRKRARRSIPESPPRNAPETRTHCPRCKRRLRSWVETHVDLICVVRALRGGKSYLSQPYRLLISLCSCPPLPGRATLCVPTGIRPTEFDNPHRQALRTYLC